MYSAFLRYVDVFNLNVVWILSAGCLIESNFYHSLLVSTMGTLVMAGCVLASHAVRCRGCAANDREAAWVPSADSLVIGVVKETEVLSSQEIVVVDKTDIVTVDFD